MPDCSAAGLGRRRISTTHHHIGGCHGRPRFRIDRARRHDDNAAFADLTKLIQDEGLSTEWDGEPFQQDDITPDQPLSLYAHEVAWGRFEALEAWCVANAVPFARWSGAYAGQWGAERVVFPGTGEPISFAADEDDYVLIGRHTVERLGSIEAIRAHFDATDFVVPPLIVAGWSQRFRPTKFRRRAQLLPHRGRGLRLSS